MNWCFQQECINVDVYRKKIMRMEKCAKLMQIFVYLRQKTTTTQVNGFCPIQESKAIFVLLVHCQTWINSRDCIIGFWTKNIGEIEYWTTIPIFLILLNFGFEFLSFKLKCKYFNCVLLQKLTGVWVSAAKKNKVNIERFCVHQTYQHQSRTNECKIEMKRNCDHFNWIKIQSLNHIYLHQKQ